MYVSPLIRKKFQIELIIIYEQIQGQRESREGSETERCNQLTKFALVVSQNTFLKGKGGEEGGPFHT